MRAYKQLMGSSLAALAGSALIAVPARADDHEIVAESFEGGTLDWSTENVTARIVTSAYATDGSKALEMVFADANEDSISIPFGAMVDATALGETNLAFDLTNTSDVSIQISVDLHSGGRNNPLGYLVIGPGETTTFYGALNGFAAAVETGLASVPPAWSSPDTKLITKKSRVTVTHDISTLERISFSTIANPKERTIVLDNIRIRTNPPADPFFLTDLVDRFGQAARLEFPTKVRDEEHLRWLAEKEQEMLAASEGAPDRSKWGGWAAGPKLEATGYFRAEKVNGKWWMVDPDGHLFFSNALANIRMANSGTQTGYDFGDPDVRYIDPEELTPEDSLGIVPVEERFRHTRYLATPLRRNLFKWLPTYDDPLGEHYGYRRTYHQGIQSSGEIYSFYQANLERRYGDNYLETWRDVSIDRMLDWGMTSFGNWVDPMFYQADRMPYFANGWIIGDFNTLPTDRDVWSSMPDVYDPEFRRRVRMTVEQVASEVQGSPWCVGVFLDNEKSWGRGETAESVYAIMLSALRQDATSSPAKAHFSAMFRERYPSIAALNAAWGTNLSSWADFDDGVTIPDPEMARDDLSAMLYDYADTYFDTVHGELETVMPNHMYLGVRMAAWGMPREAVAAATKYTDVISFNNYREIMHPDYWAFLQELDKPTLIGEFHIGSTTDSGFYHPGIIAGVDQADRARIYEQYINSVLENPVMVGAHYFQYMDEPVTGRAYDGENYNIGFVTNTDIPYPDMVAAAKRVNYGLYARRYGE